MDGVDGVGAAMRTAAAGLSSPSPEVTAQSLHTLGVLADQGAPELRAYVFSLIAPMARWSSALDGAIAAELVRAIGTAAQPTSLRLLAQFVAHGDERTRTELSGAIAAIYDGLRSEEARVARDLLLRLAGDAVDGVRSWALFNLGAQTNADGAAVRAVLVEHLDDADDDARDEAIFGLARRHDDRVLELVLARVELGLWDGRLLEAVAFLPSPRFLPALEARASVGDDVDHLIERCDPVRATARDERHAQLLVALEATLRHEHPVMWVDRCEADVCVALDSFEGATVNVDRLLAASAGKVGAAASRLRDLALTAKTDVGA